MAKGKVPAKPPEGGRSDLPTQEVLFSDRELADIKLSLAEYTSICARRIRNAANPLVKQIYEGELARIEALRERL